MKEQFEQMSLEELAYTLRDGLAVLYTKLSETNGYGSFDIITGTLCSDYPDVYIVNTSGMRGTRDIESTDIFKL